MLAIDLTGKKAFVTGGSRGIGKSICLTLAQAGADVAFTYLSNENAAKSVEKQIQEMGRKAIAYQADAADYSRMKEVLNDIEKQFSVLDIIVNNAGGSPRIDFHDLTPEQLDDSLKRNLYGPFYSIMAGIDLMEKAGGGSIINIGSSAMYSGFGGGPHYSAAKSGLMGLTRYLAVDLGPKQIRANTLAVSLIKTELLENSQKEVLDEKIKTVPLGRLGLPEDVAYMTAFLASDMGSYISGEMILMDGARTYA